MAKNGLPKLVVSSDYYFFRYSKLAESHNIDLTDRPKIELQHKWSEKSL